MTEQTDQVPNYNFTKNWFNARIRRIWGELISQFSPTRILEIGSFEGASSCYLIDTIAKIMPFELHCIDTWEGGIEHQEISMNEVEDRYDQNIHAAISSAQHEVSFVKHKGLSDKLLCELLIKGKEGYFDFIYVDGSHQSPDVLCDAVLCFKLLKVGGVMVFDDYLWNESLPYGVDPIRSPKIAVDAFTNIYCRKLEILKKPLYQLYIRKTAT